MFAVCVRFCNPHIIRIVSVVAGFESVGHAAEWVEGNADRICKNDDVDDNDMPLDKARDGSGLPHWHTFDVGVPTTSH